MTLGTGETAVAEAWSSLALLPPPPRVLPARAAVHDRPAMTATNNSCLLLSVFGVAHHDIDPPPPSSSSSLELTTDLSLWLFAPSSEKKSVPGMPKKSPYNPCPTSITAHGPPRAKLEPVGHMGRFMPAALRGLSVHYRA